MQRTVELRPLNVSPRNLRYRRNCYHKDIDGGNPADDDSSVRPRKLESERPRYQSDRSRLRAQFRHCFTRSCLRSARRVSSVNTVRGIAGREGAKGEALERPVGVAID